LAGLGRPFWLPGTGICCCCCLLPSPSPCSSSLAPPAPPRLSRSRNGFDCGERRGVEGRIAQEGRITDMRGGGVEVGRETNWGGSLESWEAV
jgi:hypothetical protein